VLPFAGGVLALLAPLLYARAQAPQPSGVPTLRIQSVSTPPLADERLPEGGLLLALVNASLSRSMAGGAAKAEVRWTTSLLSQEALSDSTVDLFLPVESADCDRPNELTQAAAVICDHAVYSEPILQVVVALFSLANGRFTFDTEESILGKTLCIWREQDLSALNANGRNWALYKRVTVLRRASLLDCVVAVQAHDADAFAAIDLEARQLLRRLGLTPYFAMQTRPLATRGVHAVVWRDHARASEILGALNDGLKRLKQSGAYASLVHQYLMAAEAPIAVASSKEAAPRSKTAGTAGGPRVPHAAPKPPPAPVPPALDPAARATALRFLKRGDEELAEGRVAPARLLYERAAEMGLAQAAMALAATYDAGELSKPHLRNVLPDAVEAARWYERARVLGAADASARLRRLGSTSK
jgi:hypothetical protein